MHDADEVLLTTRREKELLERIRSLPPETLAAVEHFVDSLGRGDSVSGSPARPATVRPPADPFTRIWNNPEDAEYDSL